MLYEKRKRAFSRRFFLVWILCWRAPPPEMFHLWCARLCSLSDNLGLLFSHLSLSSSVSISFFTLKFVSLCRGARDQIDDRFLILILYSRMLFLSQQAAAWRRRTTFSRRAAARRPPSPTTDRDAASAGSSAENPAPTVPGHGSWEKKSTFLEKFSFYHHFCQQSSDKYVQKWN